jgi:hypothetical protein
VETCAQRPKPSQRCLLNIALLAIVAIVAAACAIAPQPQVAADSTQFAAPEVQDCTIISLSVPTKYACDGKVYTSSELQQLRQAAQQGK